MDKETQDRIWAALSKDERNRMIEAYKSEAVNADYERGWNYAVRSIFGRHNLTSDEEPSELLFVERQDIINRYKAILVQQDPKNFGFSDYLQGQKELLESMFAAKCIPDKEPSVQGESRNLSQNIANCDKSEDKQLKDNMEEKELNLAELLKGCEGESFYSPAFSVVTLKAFNVKGGKPLYWDEGLSSFYTYADGRIYSDSVPTIFPSRALYEKYPLDAYSAWMEWKSERTPKRWYPEFGEKFWCLDLSMNPSSVTSALPKSKWEGELNCFKTEEECQQASEAVNRTLEEFHKNHTEP